MPNPTAKTPIKNGLLQSDLDCANHSLLNLGNSISVTITEPTGKLLWVDAVNGNNSTGTRGDAHLPFLTLAAAKTAASSGDTIMVLPGSYTGQDLLKDGVNWHFELGASVTRATATGAGIFDDFTGHENVPITCSITGEGDFDGGTGKVLFLKNVNHLLPLASESSGGSNVNFSARNVVGAGTSSDQVPIMVRALSVNIRAKKVSYNATGAQGALLYQRGALIYNVDETETTGGAAAIYMDIQDDELAGRIGTFTVDASTDLITVSTAHGLVASDKVIFQAVGGGALPTGLAAGTLYYVLSSGLTSTAIKVSATDGGSVVDITDTGPAVVFNIARAAPAKYAEPYITGRVIRNTGIGTSRRAIYFKSPITGGSRAWVDVSSIQTNSMAVETSGNNDTDSTLFIHAGRIDGSVKNAAGNTVVIGGTVSSSSAADNLIQTGGVLTVVGVKYDASKTTGTITQGQPKVAAALQSTSNLSDVTSASTSRTNLGLTLAANTLTWLNASSSANLRSALTDNFISTLTEDTTPSSSADFVMTYDASATTYKKVKLTNLPVSGSGNPFDQNLNTNDDVTFGTVATSAVGSADDSTLISFGSGVSTLTGDFRVNGSIALEAPSASPPKYIEILGDEVAVDNHSLTLRLDHASRILTLGGNLVLDNDFSTSGDYALVLTLGATTNITLPASGTLSTLAGTETFTAKRVTPRITTIVSSATPTINSDNCDCVTITALATAITSMTSGLTGTPTNFQKLLFRILDNGTARAITWGASFQACGVSLPTTTVISKRLTVGFIYDTVAAKWGCMASAQEA